MTDSKGPNVVLAVTAACILVFSGAVYAWSLVPKGDTSIIIVNDSEFTWAGIYQDFQCIDVEAAGKSYLGVKLSDIVNETGLADPGAHEYNVIGSDGYSKTVTWTDMQSGFLVEDDKIAVFPGLTRSFWVKGVVEIEVR